MKSTEENISHQFDWDGIYKIVGNAITLRIQEHFGGQQFDLKKWLLQNGTVSTNICQHYEKAGNN